jgi:hypothetical protein
MGQTMRARQLGQAMRPATAIGLTVGIGSAVELE